MQKQVRVLKPAQRPSRKDIVFGITLEKDIALFASGIFYTAHWENGDIILVSGTSLRPDNKTIGKYRFEECRIEVRNENSNPV